MVCVQFYLIDALSSCPPWFNVVTNLIQLHDLHSLIFVGIWGILCVLSCWNLHFTILDYFVKRNIMFYVERYKYYDSKSLKVIQKYCMEKIIVELCDKQYWWRQFEALACFQQRVSNDAKRFQQIRLDEALYIPKVGLHTTRFLASKYIHVQRCYFLTSLPIWVCLHFKTCD